MQTLWQDLRCGARRLFRSFINCIYGAAIGVRGKESINRTRITRMTRIVADKTKKVLCQSALSASSAFYMFYQSVHR
jgi:hypothetical protein